MVNTRIKDTKREVTNNDQKTKYQGIFRKLQIKDIIAENRYNFMIITCRNMLNMTTDDIEEKESADYTGYIIA